MGKILRALEKSKKEQSGEKKTGSHIGGDRSPQKPAPADPPQKVTPAGASQGPVGLNSKKGVTVRTPETLVAEDHPEPAKTAAVAPAEKNGPAEGKLKSSEKKPPVKTGPHKVVPGPSFVRTAAAEATDSLAPASGADGLHHTLVSLLRPGSYEAEQFKHLRTHLLFPGSGTPPRTILITSGLPGEGKSFVAANLAISFAQNAGIHVLLVDADIRQHGLSTRFGFAGDISGLSEYLAENAALPSLLRKTPLDNLRILPGGRPKPNPAELISSDRMQRLLEEVALRYTDRYVIIDAPPPTFAAETAVLARFADSVLMVVRSGVTKREIVAETIDLVGREKIKGVVLNGYDMRQSRYYGYHKYENYYNK